jgi:hypothetical protein
MSDNIFTPFKEKSQSLITVNYTSSDIKKHRNIKHFKEAHLALDKSGNVIVDVRVYWNGGNKCSAVVWIKDLAMGGYTTTGGFDDAVRGAMEEAD